MCRRSQPSHGRPSRRRQVDDGQAPADDTAPADAGRGPRDNKNPLSGRRAQGRLDADDRASIPRATPHHLARGITLQFVGTIFVCYLCKKLWL